MKSSLVIRPIGAGDLEGLLWNLVERLEEAVAEGASLGFLPPLRRDEAWQYWLSLRPELRRGSRLLLGAWCDDRLIGTGQLELMERSNGQHRAEVQRLFVAPEFRGRGVGRAIMAALHQEARQRGRSLLLLLVRRGDAAVRLYEALGYREAGIVPGLTSGPMGERYDHAIMYQEMRP